MNYQVFSDVFRALMNAENNAVMCQDEVLLAQIEEAKAGLLGEFDKSFPCCVDDVLKLSGFSCKPLFEIIAEYPSLLEGRERRFLKFVASVARSTKIRRKKKIVLDPHVVDIMSGDAIDNFVWKQIVKDDDYFYFVEAIAAVLPLAEQKKRSRSSYKLCEVFLPSWRLAFPEIGS